jgi:hypothetical protein
MADAMGFTTPADTVTRQRLWRSVPSAKSVVSTVLVKFIAGPFSKTANPRTGVVEGEL